ncbi:MAG: proton-conducting transporter membrane subunit [Bacteroidota bacterium]
MPQLLLYFILIPLAGFLVSLLMPRKKEKLISTLVLGAVGFHLAAIICFSLYWLMNDHPVLDTMLITLFTTPELEIFIDFYFDKVTAVYAVIGAAITFLVAVFSRYYLHREEGFKRFFSSLLLFYTGYNIIIFSGNFETLFIGWEFLGISSFLLIAFYRDRFLPVKNGMKVISIYRLSDICLLLAMWLSHHLWHENITFIKLNDVALVAAKLQEHSLLFAGISIMLLIAAAAKSAQFPFSSWLPRAMEGPTSSSAIFYGSLSVHIGVFLLLRTYPFWVNAPAIKVTIIILGLITILIANSIARVQSSVKTQIAYSSIVQIGIIFIEVALGFHTLALIHFTGNAFLRTYQLLVSPSVLSYLTHDQFYHFDPAKNKTGRASLNRISNSLYILSIKEWNLDGFLYRYLWSPFKWIGKQLHFLTNRPFIIFFVAVYLLGLYCFFFSDSMPVFLNNFLPVVLSLAGSLLVLRAFAERGDARKAWLLVFASQFFIVLSILLNDHVGIDELITFAGGSMLSAIAGYLCLNKVYAIDNDITLDGYHGYTYEKPTLGFIFLLSCLGLLGFPITPTFIGVDLLFSHIHEKQYALIAFTSISFVFIELSVLRIYSRVFMGQHKKAHHAIAYRSS